MAKNSKKISYGKKDLLPEKIEPQDVKVRISIMLDSDILKYFKSFAQEAGGALNSFDSAIFK